jgi:hypothetical protein
VRDLQRGRAADVPSPGDLLKNLARVEQILRQAGASSSDIAWVNGNLLPAFTPEAIAGYAESLMLQSPDELEKTVREIKSDSQYTLGPDSQQHEGVPQGRIQEFTPVESRIFPGFEHKWWLYIPAQYTEGKSVHGLLRWGVVDEARWSLACAGGARQSDSP